MLKFYVEVGVKEGHKSARLKMTCSSNAAVAVALIALYPC